MIIMRKNFNVIDELTSIAHAHTTRFNEQGVKPVYFEAGSTLNFSIDFEYKNLTGYQMPP